LAIGALLVLPGSLSASPLNQAVGQWKTAKPIRHGAEEVVGTAANGLMVVYGGLAPVWKPIGMMWLYDPGTDTWSELPSPPVAVHHAGIIAIGSRVFLVGGFKLPEQGQPAWVPQNGVQILDLSTGQWSLGAPMPTARGALGLAAVGTKLYAIGGADVPSYSPFGGPRPNWPVESTAANEVYDTETNSWAAGAIDGKIFVVGGRVGSASVSGVSTNIAANEAYDPATDRWEPRQLMPTARSGIGTAVLNGRLHVLGGEAYQGDFIGRFRSHEAYDPRTNNWERLASMPTPRHGLAVAEIAGRIYAVSGVNVPGGGGPAADLTMTEVFEP
jgi:N-acetylneuraminic acid mutarotase